MLGRLVTRDDFEYWLASIDNFLDDFRAEFPEDVRERLDFSLASLDLVESWILDVYADTDSTLAPEESRRVNNAGCYVGETLRKAKGGKWTIRLDDPKFAFHGLPLLAGMDGRSDPECPHTLVTAAADRRTGTYLRQVIGG